MKYILSFFLSFFFCSLYSQNSNVISDKMIGGNRQDRLSMVIKTLDGNLIGVGNSNSGASSFKSVASPNMDIWVCKFNIQGDKIWDYTFDGGGLDEGKSVFELADGSILIGGNSQMNEIGNPYGNTNDFDYIVIKLSSTGQIIWNKTFGGTSKENLNSIIADNLGNIYLSGNSNSFASRNKTDDILDSNNSTTDFWLVKLDYQGSKIWDKEFGYGNAADYQGKIILGSENNLILFGTSVDYSTGDYKSEFIISKIDFNGVVNWIRKFSQGLTANNLIEYKNEFYLLGSFAQYFSSTDTSSSTYKLFKLSQFGDVLWEEERNGIGHDLILDNEYIIPLISYIKRINETQYGNTAVYDIAYYRYSLTGILKGGHSFVTGPSTATIPATIINTGNFYLLFATTSGISFLDKTATGFGLDDWWMFNTNSGKPIVYDLIVPPQVQQGGILNIQLKAKSNN